MQRHAYRRARARGSRAARGCPAPACRRRRRQSSRGRRRTAREQAAAASSAAPAATQRDLRKNVVQRQRDSTVGSSPLFAVAAELERDSGWPRCNIIFDPLERSTPLEWRSVDLRAGVAGAAHARALTPPRRGRGASALQRPPRPQRRPHAHSRRRQGAENRVTRRGSRSRRRNARRGWPRCCALAAADARTPSRGAPSVRERTEPRSAVRPVPNRARVHARRTRPEAPLDEETERPAACSTMDACASRSDLLPA